jgi:hypothetical protein
MLEHVRESGMKVCCGGILGLGESEADRVDMLVTLANLPEPSESVPINMLIPIAGTPLAKAEPVGGIELVQIVATGAGHDADLFCPALRRPVCHDRGGAGALLPRRRELDLCRRHP